MRIKMNQSLYRNILISFCALIICMVSFGYFLGFSINLRNLVFYVLFLILTVVLFFIIFLVIDKTNKKYIVIDNEKITEQTKHEEKIIVYRNQIVRATYHNSIDLINCIIDFGYVEIVYKSNTKENELKRTYIYLSKKNYKKCFFDKNNLYV